ncbi:L7Ae/L30e/S12e/Gadd45 family ribosomal protein [Propionispora vibrioides]|uniref:Ribosomal protein L7Ae n=1 Tax=Propionispora vibrioides TaxID=112903 RepID=A0A1H8SMY2_9FIRM|nr:ribosomal L7Ae/L30e/S12e/Gadd45 family protein [Propionispora vibrioides]SEO79991.1 Ribosomal protein L7Ae [Propionispora vibrioides]
MKEQRVMSLLGLAQKAGKIVSGELAVEKAVRSGKAKLIVVAADGSDNTKKAYQNMAAYYKLPFYEILSKDVLGQCIGKHNRAALAVIDEGFSRSLDSILNGK